MTAKEYLSQAWPVKIQLEAMAEQLEFLKSAVEYINPRSSGLPKPSRNIHRFEDACVKAMDLENRIKERLGKLSEINETINNVSSPVSQAILVKRYLVHNTWDEIASTLCVSRSHVIRLHIEALAEVENLIRNETV